jgi:uncharacterized protein (TIGR02001 family)
MGIERAPRGVVLGGLLLAAGLARGEEAAPAAAAPAPPWSASVALATRYVSRGLDLTDGPASPQLAAEYRGASGWYVNGFAARTHYFGLTAEVDANAGFRAGFGGLRYDVGLYYYGYPGGDPRLHASYGELGARLLWGSGAVTPVVELYVTPNYFFGAGKGLFVNAGADFVLPAWLAASVRLGYVTVEDNASFVYPDYATWLVSATRSFGKWELAAQLTDTSIKRRQCLDENRCSLKLTLRVARNF